MKDTYLITIASGGKIDKNVKVFFISAFEIDHAAIRKQYLALKTKIFPVCIWKSRDIYKQKLNDLTIH